MKKLLLKLIRPFEKTNLCYLDFLLLAELIFQVTPYYIIGIIMVFLLLVLKTIGFVLNKNELNSEESTTIKTTIIIYLILFVYLIYRGY